MKYAVSLILILLTSLSFAGAIQETRYLKLSADGIDLMAVRCGAGFLKVRGVADRGEINATAQIEINGIKENELKEFIQKNLVLKLQKQENTAILQSEFKKAGFVDSEAKINLTLEVPAKIDLKIDDGSGSITVRNLSGNLEIEDESGSITIRNILGEVRVEDSSGSINMEDIRGNVMINDGSGKISIDFVKGDVKVKDGTGSMTIQDIDGNVTVSDGSGGIEIDNVEKNVFIREAGSGALRIERVKGKVTTRD